MSDGYSVMVVDDDESIREALEVVLSDEGYAVQLARDGAEALRLLKGSLPDVILLDMKMPGVDGWAFADAYRSLPDPRPPVIVLTAAPDAPRWAADISADDVLAKPFDLASLLDIVARHTTQK